MFPLRLPPELEPGRALSRMLSDEREEERDLEEGAAGMSTNVVVAGVGVGRPSSERWGEVGSGGMAFALAFGVGAVTALAGSDWMRLRALSALSAGASSRDARAGDDCGSGSGMLDPLILGEGGTTVTFGPESELSYPPPGCDAAALPLPFP